MVKTVEKDDKTLFTCEQCGFQYLETQYAQECEDACAKRGICRTDVAKQAIKTFGENTHG